MFSDLRYRFRALFRRRLMEEELDQEVRAHIEQQAEKYIQAGMSPEEAARRARIEFGGIEQVKEECREAWGVRLIHELVQDIGFGLRQLRRNPGFTAVAIITLALGIGANTAIFSVIYGVLLHPLPYPHADRIVQISPTSHGQLEGYAGFTASGFDFWKQHENPFQSLAAFTPVSFNLIGAESAEHLDALRVSSEYFHVYGVRPFLGRDFGPGADVTGSAKVAILSYGLWKSHFNGNPNAIGRSISLDGAPYTVIGVMPAGFTTIPPAALWAPIGPVRKTIGSGQNYQVIGRLRSGISEQQASSYLAGLTRPFLVSFGWVRASGNAGLSFVVVPYRYAISSNVRLPLLLLFAAIGLVLLIACVNVANLLLARMASRGHEIALRSALGAGRVRLFRQLLTESVLLAIIGAALGLLVAFLGLNSLLALVPVNLPRAQNIALSGWVLLFTAGVAVFTGLLFGIAPALIASRTNLNESLKEREGRTRSEIHRRRLSTGMLAAEAALSLILLIGSGLLIRTFFNLLNTNPGFNPHHELALEIWPSGLGYNSTAKLANFYRELITRIGIIPGVKNAAMVTAGLPLERGGNVNPGIWIRGRLERPSTDYREVTPEYFQTLRDPLLAGRAFSEADSSTGAKVTIINSAFVQKYFHDQNPLGRQIVFDHNNLEIVGVAGDVRTTLNEPAPPTFFVPVAQAPYDVDRIFQAWSPTCILVRTSVKPLALSHSVESAVRDFAPNLPIGQIKSMEEVFSTSLAFERFLMVLMSLFAGLALVLTIVGLYGVLSYWVAQRTREIGIRMALGAKRRDVLRLVLGQGLRLTLIGVAIGIAGALALTRFLSSLLYGVKPTDPLTFVAVSLILIAVALLACYIPARRATKIDPMVALRYE